MNIYYNTSVKVPTHVTISNWVKKVGYYQLSHPKVVADDWVIIIDESIQIGSGKLLLILGVRSGKIDFSRPLNFQNVLPILQVRKPGWDAKKMKFEIEKAKGIVGTIKYAVSDKGASISKALELCGIPQVHDITHRMANILKKVYKNDAEFKSYMEKVAKLRLQIQQTKWAYLLLPQQRSQSRFLNLKPMIKWGVKVLDYLERIHNADEGLDDTVEIDEKLQWIREKELFIRELNHILNIINKIFKIVKSGGMSNETVAKCYQHIDGLHSVKGKIVKHEIRMYINEVLSTVQQEKQILCTSDIIESTFGMYKNTISKNALNGITNLSLCMPARTNQILPNEIKQIMEKVESKMIFQWTEENIGKSLLQERKKVFMKHNYGAKNNLKKVA